MAPLVVIRAGAKEIEYRDPRASWKQRVAEMVREHELRANTAGDESDGSSSGNSDEEEDDEDEVPTVRVYGMKAELLALGGMRVFRCAVCANVVADRDDIIAKSFWGRTGKAFLMNAMFNVHTGPPRDRYLMTGRHTICDVQCTRCDEVLGWKYIRAMEASQKYKEGKFIMERAVVEDDNDDKTRV